MSVFILCMSVLNLAAIAVVYRVVLSIRREAREWQATYYKRRRRDLKTKLVETDSEAVLIGKVVASGNDQN